MYKERGVIAGERRDGYASWTKRSMSLDEAVIFCDWPSLSGAHLKIKKEKQKQLSE